MEQKPRFSFVVLFLWCILPNKFVVNQITTKYFPWDPSGSLRVWSRIRSLFVFVFSLELKEKEGKYRIIPALILKQMNNCRFCA